nr:hypothetical protein [Mycoplasmopsis bovis]
MPFCAYHFTFYGVESYHQFIFRAPSLAKLSSSSFAIFSPSVSKSLSSFLSKNSFSLGNLYFFVFRFFEFVPFGLLEEFGCFGPFEEFVPFGFLGFFSGLFEEFVPFGLLEEFGWLLVLLRSLFLLVFWGFFSGPFEEFVPFGFFWSFSVLLRSLFLLVFWKSLGCFGPFEEFVPFGLLERVWSSWSFVSEFAPVPSSVFSTSHEQRLLVEMKLILLKLKL